MALMFNGAFPSFSSVSVFVAETLFTRMVGKLILAVSLLIIRMRL